MVDDGKITLTLGELKEYFKIWHENNFNDLHAQKIRYIISTYLNDNGIQAKIDIINDIKTSVINAVKALSKIIDGTSDLTNSSTLENIITELNNKYNNFKNNNDYNSLVAISDALTNHTTLINNLSQQKATTEYVDNLITQISSQLGVMPKQIQTQDMPVVEFGNDLNNYKTPGIYRSKNAANTSSLQNVPSEAQSSAFVLVVIQHMDNSVRQLLLTAEASDIGNNIFTRNYVTSSNTWSGGQKWNKLYGDHNTQPLQMKVEWSDDPQGLNPTTYTLLQIRE